MRRDERAYHSEKHVNEQDAERRTEETDQARLQYQERKDVARPGADRAQDRHLPPPLIQAGQDGSEDGDDAHRDDKYRDRQQGALGNRGHTPELRERL